MMSSFRHTTIVPQPTAHPPLRVRQRPERDIVVDDAAHGSLLHGQAARHAARAALRRLLRRLCRRARVLALGKDEVLAQELRGQDLRGSAGGGARGGLGGGVAARVASRGRWLAQNCRASKLRGLWLQTAAGVCNWHGQRKTAARVRLAVLRACACVPAGAACGCSPLALLTGSRDDTPGRQLNLSRAPAPATPRQRRGGACPP